MQAIMLQKKGGAGGKQKGFNNPRVTYQIYLFRHVTGGLTTKCIFSNTNNILELWHVLILFHVLKGVATFTTYLWFLHKGVERSLI